ncbi:hypothetical protein [Nitrococcus mobilis]|uniref:Uncharacterized protein n=1 Tax=Nitrococcus mobilis Nb-231 TaxID=314278 RepID=A4BN68_9GAMM|nr:hypothetical protein [Nitrococcus mobilis]EAR22667.1 hypothetical protein NB231_09453 [Nitrococcus mobilis Nb-231]
MLQNGALSVTRTERRLWAMRLTLSALEYIELDPIELGGLIEGLAQRSVVAELAIVLATSQSLGRGPVRLSFDEDFVDMMSKFSLLPKETDGIGVVGVQNGRAPLSSRLLGHLRAESPP